MIAGMSGFEGTGALARLAVRRDRLLLGGWISVLVLMVASSAGAAGGLYPTVALRVQGAEAINRSPSMVAMFGRIYDPASLGAVAMVKMSVLGAAMVAVMAAMITIRHSRAEEETGRLELVGAAVVGRRAPLTAALAVSVAASAAVGVLSAIGLIAAGLPAAGSFAFGASWAGVGVAFGAVAAVAAQLTRTARSAMRLTIGCLGSAYVLRAIGDSSDGLGWMTWASPLGWAHHMRAFAGNRWALSAPLVAFALAATACAYALGAERDLGAGLLPERAGRAGAGTRLRSSLGLAWRLERGALAAWAVGFALTGLVVGSIAGDVGSIANSSTSRDLIFKLGGEKGLTDAFLAAELGVLGLVTAAYGVHAALSLRSEETALRAEAVLATGLGRLRWAGSHLLVAVTGTTCLAVTVGVAAGVAHALRTARVGAVPAALGGALVQLPAIWVVIGFAMVAFGIDRRTAFLGWVALVFFVLLGEVGPLLDLPRSMIDLSPFAHVPHLPASTLRIAPLAALLGTATLLTGIGFAGLRRRDIG